MNLEAVASALTDTVAVVESADEHVPVKVIDCCPAAFRLTDAPGTVVAVALSKPVFVQVKAGASLLADVFPPVIEKSVQPFKLWFPLAS